MRVSPALPPYYIAYLLILSQALRELIFGSARGPSFNVEWKKQNFFFCDLPDLEYGLIQHKVCLNMATGVKTEHHWVPTDLTLCCRSPSSEIFCTMFSPTHRVGRVAYLHILNLLPHSQGGPCGVLACVQAHILKHLLFSDPTKDLTSRLANLLFPS